MSTKNWRHLNLKSNRILLDEINPRLPEYIRGGDQREICHYMVERYQLDRLARSIIKRGLFTHKLPIVIKKNNKYTVLEGNRRIATIKCLLNYKKAPRPKWRVFKRFASLVDISDIETIEVMVAPSRKDARQLIFSDHTDNLILGWSPIQKARFCVGGLETGMSPEELADIQLMSVNEVLDNAKFCLVYRMACKIESIDTKILNILADEDKFNFSTFERIIGNPPFNREVPIHLDGSQLKIGCDKQWFNNILKKIVTDIVLGQDRSNKEGVTSRILNSASDLHNYFEEVVKEYPKKGEGGSFTYSPDFGDQSPSPQDETAAKTRKRKTYCLIPKNFQWGDVPPKLEYLLQEAQEISTNKFPHASAILLRTILEQSIYYLFERRGCADELDDKDSERRFNLKKLINKAQTNTDIIEDRQLKKAVNAFVNSEDFKSLDTMNQYTHSQYLTPTKEQLSSFWVTLKPIFEYCLFDGAEG